MKNARIFKCVAVAVLLFVGLFVHAEEWTPASVPNIKEQGQQYYVSDPDGLLSASDVDWLNTCAQDLEQKTEVELCVVALESIGDLDAFDFSYELFQRWGLGKKGRNTGVLILFVEASHDIRIMTGTGIEGVLTDAVCATIIREDMVPAFRAGEYGNGLCQGALRIAEICTNGDVPEELLSIRSATNRGIYENAQDDDDGLSDGMLVWIVIGGMVLFCVGVALYEAWEKNHRKCPKCKQRKGKTVLSKTVVSATYDHGGEGYYDCCCAACGHKWRVNWTTSKLTRSSSSSGRGYSSSGGGGGSWGGGSTSGGGAGGKW